MGEHSFVDTETRPQANSRRWFTTSFLWRKVPESDARSVDHTARSPSTQTQALVYDIPLEEGAGKRCSECGPHGPFTFYANSKHWFTTSFLWRKVPESGARSVDHTARSPSTQTPSTGLRHPSFGGRCRKAVLGVWTTRPVHLLRKLQALVYDIPLEEGAGKRCSECGPHGPFTFYANSKHWFTTSFLWRKVPESGARSVDHTARSPSTQTPSTGLRHPSFGGRCRKAVLGVWTTRPVHLLRKLQALVYDILPLEEGAGKRCSECGPHGPFTFYANSKHWFTTSFLWRKVPESGARSVDHTARSPSTQTPSTGLRHPSFGGRCRKAVLGVWTTRPVHLLRKLQALVYDILPLEEGAGKRCSECGPHGPFTFYANSKHWFTTSFLWRKVPESGARSVDHTARSPSTQTPSTGLRHPSTEKDAGKRC